MPVPQVTYPLDLSGMSPNNLVVAEPQALPVGVQNRAFVPNHGPFFTRGLVVRDAANGTVLTPRVQYQATQLFADASLRTGMEVCSIIVVVDPTVSANVVIDYQVLGGEFSSSVYAIQQLIDSLSLDDRPVFWGDILGKPEAFPPTPHLHDLGDLYGFEYLVAALEGVRRAILQGDEAAHAAIYQYIDLRDNNLQQLIDGMGDLLDAHIHDYNNPHQTTKTHVGLGLVENFPLASILEAQQGTRNDRYMTPALVRSAILALADSGLAAHIENMNNPHQTTKAQVGLGLVQNFDVATLNDAIAGTRNDLYLTPYLARQAWLAWGGGTGGGGGGDPLPPPGANQLPVASFTYSGNTSAAAGTSPTWPISFNDTSVSGTDETATNVPIVAWSWNFGDGTAGSTQQNPSHTYTTTGVKNITLTATDGLGRSATKTVNITLTQLTSTQPPQTPVIDLYRFNTGGSLATDGMDTTYALDGTAFTVFPKRDVYGNLGTGYNTNLSYFLWDFGQGTAVVSGANVTTVQRPISSSDPGQVTFTSPGVKTLSLKVHVEGGTHPGDSEWGTRNLNCVVASPPNAEASILGSRTVAQGEDFLLTIYPFQQDAQANGGTVWSTMGTLPFSTMKLTSADGGQFWRNKGTPQQINLGSTVTNDANWAEFPFFQVFYTTPGVKTIRLEVFDTWGFRGFIDKEITLVRASDTGPTSNFTYAGQTNVVEGTNPTISFTNTSLAGTNAIVSYQWSFVGPNGVNLGSYTGPNPSPITFNVPTGTSTGSATLVVTDSTGMSSTRNVSITFVKTAAVAPTANFGYSPTSNPITVAFGDASYTMSFTNMSSQGTYPIVSWTWNWGDGTTSSTENPGTHSFEVPVGTTQRTITLTVTDSNGNSSLKSSTVTFQKTAATGPTASFLYSGQTTVLEGNNHQITASSTSTAGSNPISTWAWDWGDGTTSTGATPAAHVYNVPVGSTVRRITLLVTDQAGLTATTFQDITLTKNAIVNPTANFDTTYPNGSQVFNNAQAMVEVDDNSVQGTGTITSWVWNWGDGTANSTGSAPGAHTYAVAPNSSQTFTITLTVTDSLGRSNSMLRQVTLTKVSSVNPPTNLDFELGDVGYTKSGTFAIGQGDSFNGSWRGRVTFNGSNSSGGLLQGGLPCTPGETKTVAAQVRPWNAASAVGGQVRMLFLDVNGNFLPTQYAGNEISVSGGTTWRISYATGVVPANAAYYTMQVEAFVVQAAGIVDFDVLDLNYVIPDPPPEDPDPGCVVEETIMYDGNTAGTFNVGDNLLSTDPYTGVTDMQEILYAESKLKPCVRVTMADGTVLECSTSAPLATLAGTYVLAVDALGSSLATASAEEVQAGSFTLSVDYDWSEVVSVEDIGTRMVRHIYAADKNFWASKDGLRFVLHHNLKDNEPGIPP